MKKEYYNKVLKICWIIKLENKEKIDLETILEKIYNEWASDLLLMTKTK